MKRYSRYKNGEYYKNKKLDIFLPKSSVILIMEKLGIKQMDAEQRLIAHSLDLRNDWDSDLCLSCIEGDQWNLGKTEKHEETDDIRIAPAQITF